MRFGDYVLDDNGNAYKYNRDSDGRYFLSSSNEEDKKYGFYESNPGCYRKYLDKDEVCIYKIRTVCKYNGYSFNIIKENKDKYLISLFEEELCKIGDPYKIDEASKKIGLDERYDTYTKWVNKTEVENVHEVIEQKDNRNKDKIKYSRDSVTDSLDLLEEVSVTSIPQKHKRIDSDRLPSL